LVKERSKASNRFVKVGHIIQDVLRSQRKHGDAKMIRVWDVWPLAVGEPIGSNSRPAAFKGQLLIVNVIDSAWLQQLWFLKKDIIRKVNDSLGEDLVGEIKFKIGPV
jgi:predicted nucleic acid-binding Zn ribbon protein